MLRPWSCDCARVGKILLAATAVGLITGFFGMGGGFALLPALVLALGFAMPVAVGTSLLRSLERDTFEGRINPSDT